jgi:serine/threonine protein phosphatase 1
MSLKFFQRLVGKGPQVQQDPNVGRASPKIDARIPDGLRVYAVGDVHGRVDLFDKMAGLIAQDLADYPLTKVANTTGITSHPSVPTDGSEPSIGENSIGEGVTAIGQHRRLDGGSQTIGQAGGRARGQAMLAGGVVTVFLGDYIDRGPSSREVIDRLVGGEWSTPFVTLMGNHELMCLQFLQNADTLSMWRNVGALSTLASYGVDVSPLMAANMAHETAEGIRIAFEQAMPQAHFDFMTASLQPCSSVGDFFFCHAGVRPGVPLEDQDALDLMTIRDAFLGSDADFGKVIVHGHTPQEQPVFRRNRIGIDTGAYATGCLTCLVLEGSQVRTFDTR